MHTLTITGLTHRFGNVGILHAVTLELGPGHVTALLGPSGAGKTTLARCIAGLDTSHTGTIRVGTDLWDDPIKGVHCPAHRREIGFVFQHLALWPHLTVIQHLTTALRGRRVARVDWPKRITHWLNTLRLDHLAHRRPASLSGGERQRLALARALCTHPRLIIADEPWTHLDPPLRHEWATELRRLSLALGAATLVLTHDHREALRIADQVAVLNRGALEQIGTPHNLVRAPQTAFVAQFVGRCNVVPLTGLWHRWVSALETKSSINDHATCLIPPASLVVLPAHERSDRLTPATVVGATIDGHIVCLRVVADGVELEVNLVDSGAALPAVGTVVALGPRPKAAVFVTASPTDATLLHLQFA